MFFAVANFSSHPDVTSPLLAKIVDTLEAQLFEDYAPLWQASGTAVTLVAPETTAHLSLDACLLAIFDHPDQAGVLGWHDYAPGGHIYGRAFMDAVKNLTQGPESLTTTFSHEMLEAIENPYVNNMVQISDTELEWKELCDRTQEDVYEKNGISLSNFLGPRAFRDGPGPYDHLGLLKTWNEIRPNGYAGRVDLTTGKTNIVWGSHVSDAKKHKKLSRSLRIRRRKLDLDLGKDSST